VAKCPVRSLPHAQPAPAAWRLSTNLHAVKTLYNLSGGEPRASRAKNRDDRRHVLPIHELVDEGVQVRAQLNAAHLSLEPDENEGRLLVGLLRFEQSSSVGTSGARETDEASAEVGEAEAHG
jgi:hypothetical protein